MVDTEEEKEETITKIEEFCATIDDLLGRYQNTIENKDDTSLFEQLKADWEEYKVYMQEVIKYSKAEQDEEVKKIILIESDELGNNIRSDLITFMKNNAANADHRAQYNKAVTQNTAIMMIIVIVVGV